MVEEFLAKFRNKAVKVRERRGFTLIEERATLKTQGNEQLYNKFSDHFDREGARQAKFSPVGYSSLHLANLTILSW